MALMRLTDQAYSDFITNFSEFKREPQEVARSVIKDGRNLEVLSGDLAMAAVSLDENKWFEDRKEFGEYLAAKLSSIGDEYFDDHRLWTWIVLFYAPQILAGDNSKGKVGEMARWASSVDPRTHYRHLARGPFNICREFGDSDDVKALLLGGRALDGPGEVYEQLYGRTDSARYPGVLQGLSQIYVRDGRIRKGVAGKDSPGTVRRVAKLLSQLAATHYLEALSPADLIALLPKEYDRWLEE